MNCLSWNCRGLGSLRAVRLFGDLLKSRNPDFVFLSETLVETKVIKKLSEKFGFFDYFAIDKVGRGGGLAIMWKRTIDCRVVNHSINYIDVHIMNRSNVDWRLTCFYGLPERNRRHDSWNLIRSLVKHDNIMWCIYGDFNNMLFVTDKSGSHGHPQSLLDGFKAAIEDSSLVELDLTGVNSHHDPILLELFNSEFSRKQFRFKFENTWLHEPSFREEVSNQWKEIPRMHLLPKLMSISSFMAKWGRNFFHKFRDKVKKQKAILNELIDRSDEEGVRCYFGERRKLEELLLHEEQYWKQRAKAFWLTEGDTNSKFFHATTSKRKKSNFISHLVNNENEIISSHDDMCREAVEYFKSVFTGANSSSVNVDDEVDRVISDAQNEKAYI
ncbi:uncharacterized protein LOC141696441 [Apium graveolens]|uniref:uncharacterized protein LOC141696441 n=1 Tax=Apium graveolens TaxID=4045 RepID=UPI003D7A3C3C